MNEFEVYKEYLALKRHFNSSNFDYFKYSGKTRFSVNSYEKRNDKKFFKVLAKEKDPKSIIISNLIYSDKWIGEICLNEESHALYTQWMKINQSLSYVYEAEISKIKDLKQALKIEGGHPEILKMYFRNEIHLETLIILIDVCRCYSYLNNALKGDILWKEVSLKIVKYKPFLSYDRQKMKLLTKKVFS